MEVESNNKIVAPVVSKSLIGDLRQIIEQARARGGYRQQRTYDDVLAHWGTHQPRCAWQSAR